MSSLDEFDLNDAVTLTATFKVSDVLTDPTTIALAVTDPSGNVDNFTFALAEITRTSTGIYTKDVTADEAGEWLATYTGTGACIASGTQRFAVRRAGA